MTLADIIIILLVSVTVSIAIVYIRREKKQGKCIGCPHAKECAAKRAGSCDSMKKRL